ncbi:hypothetical protein MAR_003527 [Mya arenaria]|uniref:Spermatogenesis-associated protein 18 n=1 Tax=Mya arenaria TaxID=6604 RepID=A0ABY7G944_MYAAR|nr:hypothetical protein MAR_003527 [Mya arenaria]
MDSQSLSQILDDSQEMENEDMFGAGAPPPPGSEQWKKNPSPPVFFDWKQAGNTRSQGNASQLSQPQQVAGTNSSSQPTQSASNAISKVAGKSTQSGRTRARAHSTGNPQRVRSASTRPPRKTSQAATTSTNQGGASTSGEEIDMCVNQLCTYIESVSEPLFGKDSNNISHDGTASSKSKMREPESTQLFTNTCEENRKQFYSALNEFRKDKSNINRQAMVEARTNLRLLHHSLGNAQAFGELPRSLHEQLLPKLQNSTIVLAATPERLPTITEAPSEVSPVKEDKSNPPRSSSSSRIRVESKRFSMASLHSSPVQGPHEGLQAGLASFSLTGQEPPGSVLLATSVWVIVDLEDFVVSDEHLQTLRQTIRDKTNGASVIRKRNLTVATANRRCVNLVWKHTKGYIPDIRFSDKISGVTRTTYKGDVGPGVSHQIINRQETVAATTGNRRKKTYTAAIRTVGSQRKMICESLGHLQVLLRPSQSVNIPTETIARQIQCSVMYDTVQAITDAVLKEITMERYGLEFKTYVKACAELCVQMAISPKPPHVEFHQSPNGMRFDTEIYKYYTKLGPKIEFFVWKPMYVKKDGPLLCKGVAQGMK